MLALTRKPLESVTIGEGPTKCVVTVVWIGSDRVRLAFEADPSVPIHRDDLKQKTPAADAAAR